MSAGARVLVVDDEAPLRRLLRLYLSKEGIAVTEATNGTDALALVRRGDFDLAIVDVMLPEMDGFELVRRIRRESTLPIIFVTARGEETNRVAGLELGADDYVVKPFSAPEVVARVRAHLRRAAGFDEPDPVLRVGSVELVPSAHSCRVEDRPIELTPREFDLLETLLRHPGRTFTRDQLLQEVWGSTFVISKTVDVHMAGLRRKLGNAVRITTLRGIGYRLEP
jgi:DNA-binding response OmpR family regulator